MNLPFLQSWFVISKLISTSHLLPMKVAIGGCKSCIGSKLLQLPLPYRSPLIRVVQFEVRPKVRVRKFSRILTNLKSAVRSLVKVRQT